MANTPTVLVRRYLPFLAVAGVGILLAVVATSRGGEAGRPVAAPRLDGRPAASGGGDRSDCTPDGFQKGPAHYAYMPQCVPAWHGGDNGGSTMPGVTATQINFVFYQLFSDPRFAATLASSGNGASDAQRCAAEEAFLNVINRHWSTYGRKFAPLDGPGANRGSSQPGCGGFPHFQSQCPLSPHDPNCDAAEAKVVASLHPAFVIGFSSGVFPQGLVSLHVPFLGVGGGPESSYAAAAPYLYGVNMDATRGLNLDAEYWCKKLNAQPANFAGTDVKMTRGWGSPPTAVPVRKIALVFPGSPTDDVGKQQADQLKQNLSGGRCTSPGGVLEISYHVDVSTAQQQSDTIVQELIANKITTIACLCDQFATIFFTNTAASQNYFPEYFLPAGADIDSAGRLANQAEWSHAFGVGAYIQAPPLSQSDAQVWYNAGGKSGSVDPTETLAVSLFGLMANAFQQAGIHPTVLSIAEGLHNGPVYGGWAKYHDPGLYEVGFKAPDLWTAIEDVREVYWSSTRISTVDNKAGSYCPVNGGQRYNLGEFPGGSSEIFNTTLNGC